MAKFIKGVKKGKEMEIRMCSADGFIMEDGSFVVPTMLQLTEGEADHAVHCPRTQLMRNHYELRPNLTFRKKLLN